MSKAELFTQLTSIQGVTVDPLVKKDLESTYRTLQIEEKILPVKEFREEIKLVREKASGGSIILISEGGKLKELSDTTVVLSLETLQQTITNAIMRGITTATRRRGRPADFVAGLPKVPESARSMDWELDLDAGIPADDTDLDA